MDPVPRNTEVSPARSVSTKGLKGLKARLSRKETPSTTSLAATPAGDNDGRERTGLRSSLDSIRKGGNVDEDGVPTGAMGKLIPAHVKRKKRQQADDQRQDEAERGRSVDETAATSADGQSPANNYSPSLPGEDEGASLRTTETESDVVDQTSMIAPPLLSRDSHAGYLTSSSPLIKTTAPPDSPRGLALDDVSFQNPQYHSRAATSSAAPQISSSRLGPQYATTLNGDKSDRSSSNSRTRGVSPGAKIKEVFSSGSRRKGDSPPKSPVKVTMTPKSDTNGLADSSKRKGADAGTSLKASDSVQSFNTDPSKSTASSSRDLPLLNTEPQTPQSAGRPSTPKTTVTPPTPILGRISPPTSPSLSSKPFSAGGTNPNTAASSSGNLISHRRVRSDSVTHAPSKLSNAISAPLTPMPEESRSSSGRLSGSQGSPGGGGFFSSVFTAAQNMTTQLTNTIANNPPRPRSLTQGSSIGTIDGSEDTGEAATDMPSDEKKPLAIETLGAGELSLSHLGIDTPATLSSTSRPQTNMPESDKESRRDEAVARAETASAARAVSQAYSEKPLSDSVTPTVEDSAPGIRPRSTYESSIATGDKTPPNGSVAETDAGFRRSASVRSKVGAVAKRHRNSSSATGGAIGAAITASHSTLINPTANGGASRLNGFAVASKKRNRDYHQLFRSVPEDDFLIEDYSCALQRDIILAGRIYVSEGHICFSSNILGWVTTLVISFDEVVSVEKENTAMVFPNAIAIQTLHARHTFRSLLSREATYDLLIGIWKINHPSLKSSLNGVRLDNNGTGDKTEKIELGGSDDVSDASNEEEEVYDEDEDEDEDGEDEGTEAAEGSVAASEAVTEPASKSVNRKVSSMGVAVGAAAGDVPTASDAKAIDKAAIASAASADFPGPATHEPTECADGATHFDKLLKDDIIPAPLGKVYSMVFGPASGGFMAKWLLDEIKVTDLQKMEEDTEGIATAGSSRTYSYIKPLNAPIGPKQTKCNVTETLDFIDLEKSVSVTQSTQTPDVPSGNVFVTKTRTCFMWAPGNQTRVLMNFTIEWSGKSWIKGPIEKGAADGQGTYCNDLVKALKAGVTRSRTTSKSTKKGGSNGKRRKNDLSAGSANNNKSLSASSKSADQAGKQSMSWGPLEPMHAIVGPIGDILSSFISANMVIAFLLFIILINYFRSSSSSSFTSSPSASSAAAAAGAYNRLSAGPISPERIAAYEALWQREEADLWDWLDERVGGMYAGTTRRRDESTASSREQKSSEKLLRHEGGRMAGRQVDEAIRVTEERLRTLKDVVRRKKGGQEEEERS